MADYVREDPSLAGGRSGGIDLDALKTEARSAGGAWLKVTRPYSTSTATTWRPRLRPDYEVTCRKAPPADSGRPRQWIYVRYVGDGAGQ